MSEFLVDICIKRFYTIAIKHEHLFGIERKMKMASIEFIEKRIAGKEKELNKLNKKLERIRKVEAQNWQDPNPYYYSEYDLKYTLRDIEKATKDIANYKAQLAIETEKANSRNIPVIVEFLNNWKLKVTSYYTNGLQEYYMEKEYLRDLYNKIGHYYYEAKTPKEIGCETARKANTL